MTGAVSELSDMDRVVRLSRLLQFGDSMLPIGGFSFSSGLESAIQKGLVFDVPTLEGFTRTALEQAALGDGIGLIRAHCAAVAGDLDELEAIDRRIYGRKLSAETRLMSVRVGKKFAELGSSITEAPLLDEWLERIKRGSTPGCYPVGLAINFAVHGLSDRDAFIVHQYGVASMILGAALRLMRVSHVETQRILYDLNAGTGSDYELAARSSLDDMSGFAPLLEILAAVHVKSHVRLFMN